MSTWPGKFVIGLTGNIATGKSVVRKMLEHVGAFGIDADALSHRALEVGAPGYQRAVDAFGVYILKGSGEVDRKKLGQLVFADPSALKLLENIVHPIVRQGVDHLVRKSKSPVVVIEAIKLLESPLRDSCDVIWVTTASERIQLARLKKHRDMNEVAARQRMANQSPQSQKILAADTVIDNSGSIEETWEQVKEAWKHIFPEAAGETVPTRLGDEPGARSQGGLTVARARPRQAAEIAQFMASVNGAQEAVTRVEIMNSFGDKAYLLLADEAGATRGLLGWKVENLVARVDDIFLAADLNTSEALPFLMEEVERASRDLQCEIALVFVDGELAKHKDLWMVLGYEQGAPKDLSVGAWQEAALEHYSADSVMLFKQLRADRVLRPI
jgi:dephospho-CoA kinase